jgi:electron transfer flavoprotein-quinone oxidoreductase
MPLRSSRFDVIVVGAGPAGSTAAYHLAKRGFSVLLIERGRVPGSKNVFGGRVYLQPLKEIFEDFEESAPIHRWVCHERFSLVSRDGYVSFEYRCVNSRSFTTFLTQLARWMASKAEEAGAILLTEVRVDSLYMEDGRVKGVVAGGERVEADVVIDAEGVNRLLLERAGFVKRPRPEHLSLGIKEVIKMSSDRINEVFGLGEREGLAWVMMGEVTAGVPGGAFIYTQSDAVSIGLVLSLKEAAASLNEHVSRYIESLRTHRMFSRYLAEGTIIEYSAHLIPESPHDFAPPNYQYDGLLITGDAAGLQVSMGYNFRGVDLAAYSGYLAAKAYEKAHGVGRFDRETLKYYSEMLRESIVMRQIGKFRRVYGLLRNERIFKLYPKVATDLAHRLFNPDGPSPRIIEAFKEAKRANRLGWPTIIKDLIRMVMSI